MKKYFIVALSAIVMLAFSSCEEKNKPIDGGDQKVVVLSEHSLTMGVGEKAKLSATLSPVPNTNITIEWSSTNDTIVTVASGIVETLSPGTVYIIASAIGYGSDTCEIVVTKDALLDNFTFTNYALFGSSIEPIEGTDTVMTLSDNKDYKMQLCLLTLIAWDDNITFVDGKGFDGDGYVIYTDFPIYVIVEGNDKGQLVGNRSGFFVDEYESDDYVGWVAEAGKMVDSVKYCQFWQQYFAYLQDTTLSVDMNLYYDSKIGTQVFEYNFTEGWYTWDMGNVKFANFNRDENGEFIFTAKIQWFDWVNDDRWFGVKVEYGEDGTPLSVVEPYDIRYIEREYTNVVVEENDETNNSYQFIDMKNVHIGQELNLPTVFKLKTDIMYRK